MINKDALKSYTEDDNLYIIGIANSGRPDVAGDKLTAEALKSIVEQAPRHNLHLEHDKTLNGVIGSIESAELTPEGVKFKSRILNDKKQYIKSLLEQGIELGASISGTATRTPFNKKNITDWNLTEISLTAYPCDQNTIGTVQISKSLNEVINEIENENNENNNNSDNMADEEKYITEEKVIELINTAHAEKAEELEKLIAEKVGAEVEAKFAAVEERLKAIESKLKEDEKTEDKPAEDKQEENKEEKPAEDKPEENKEDEKDTDKDLTAFKNEIQKELKETLKEMFNPQFKYQDKSLKDTQAETQENKTAYTPAELAKMILNK